MNFSPSSLILLSTLIQPWRLVDATSIKMDFLPVGFVRTDPIISKTCLSDHVHTFYGPQLVHPRTDYDDLINSSVSQNTGNIEENKSLYWHPTVYSYDQGSNTYTRDEMAQTSAYYIWENGVNTEAFPNGFRMIAGNNPGRADQFPNAGAECVNPSPCRRDNCDTPDDSFFPQTACAELEASMSFPTCWNGELDSDDHQSHVAYTLNGELDGLCPDSHPRRLPQIQFFFRIMPYSGGWHTFSDLSSVFHADYMSGWDENFLQGVLDNCVTDSFAANPNSFCEEFVTFRDGPKCTDEDECDFGDPELLAKLQAIQPPALDTSFVTNEATTAVGSLPRGLCNGNLLDGGPTSTPGPAAVPSISPTTASTPPVIPPTESPVDDGDEDDEDGEGDESDEGDEGDEDESEDEDEDGSEDEQESEDEDEDGSEDEQESEDEEDGSEDEQESEDENEDTSEEDNGEDEEDSRNDENEECLDSCWDRFYTCQSQSNFRRCNVRRNRCLRNC